MSHIAQYLRDILQELVEVEAFTEDGLNAFLADRKTQKAVIQCYMVIGEIVKRLPNSLLDSQSQVKWQDIKEFRDFLAHNYNKIDLEYVWNAVEDLPNLKAAVENLLTDLDDNAV